MVDLLSSDAILKHGYRCFGKRTPNSNVNDLVDITDKPQSIYFSTMGDLSFTFKKPGYKDFRLWLCGTQTSLYFESCDLIKHVYFRDTTCCGKRTFVSSLRESPYTYSLLLRKFSTEEILYLINNPVELYLDHEGNVLEKEEFELIMNTKYGSRK